MCDRWKDILSPEPEQPLAVKLSAEQVSWLMDNEAASAVLECLEIIKDVDPGWHSYKLNSRIIARFRPLLERAGFKIHENNCQIVLT